MGNPEASADKTRGGWFHSGDIGFKDDEGWVYFCYRDGQSIRRNGDFVDPRPIETAISEMDGVEDVFVYGAATVENAPGEKEVVAAIVSANGFDASAVFSHCSTQLGSSAAPSIVQMIDEIPKTASEKPQERFLVELLASSDARLFAADGPIKIELKERNNS